MGGEEAEGEPLGLILKCEYLVRGSTLNGCASLAARASSLGPFRLLGVAAVAAKSEPHIIDFGPLSVGCEDVGG